MPTGLSQRQAESQGDGNGEHSRGQTVWLSGVHPKRTEGADVEAGMTVDQIAAQAIGKDTPLLSLEMALEQNYLVGNCDNGYSCVYWNTISWRNADHAAADGSESARRVRAAVRRRRHPAQRLARCARIAAFSIRCGKPSRACRVVSAPAIAPR